MVQERYGVQLSTPEKGRLRQMIQSRQELRPSHHPGTHSAENR